MSKIYINNIPVFLRVSETDDFFNSNREIMQVSYRDKKELLDLIRYIEHTSDLKEVHIIGKNQEKVRVIMKVDIGSSEAEGRSNTLRCRPTHLG